MKALFLSLVFATMAAASAQATATDAAVISGQGLLAPTSIQATAPIGATLVDGVTKSCFARAGHINEPLDVLSRYFQINQFVIYWNDIYSDLQVTEIKVQIGHPLIEGGSYTATISGLELASLNGSRAGWDAWVPRAYPGGQTVFNAQCNPVFGGVKLIPNGDVHFTARGSLMMTGIRRDSRGFETVVNFGAPLIVENFGSY